MIKKENQYFIFDTPINLNFKYVVKMIIARILAIYYKILIYYYQPRMKNNKRKYKVTICAIFKNEAMYLREWIEFHRIVGVEHFYLYNNNSNDEYLRILDPYIEKGIVTLVDWPYQQAQMEAYNDCVKRFKLESHWIGFIDIDEFVVPNEMDTIYDFLKAYKYYPAVVIYWRVFGSSGKIKRDVKRLVTEDFISCWPKLDSIGKCFYNTSYVLNSENKHNKTFHHQMWAAFNNKYFPPINLYGNFIIFERQIAKKKYTYTDKSLFYKIL